MATDFSPEILDQLLGGGTRNGNFAGRCRPRWMTWRSGRATPSHFIRKLPFNSFSRELESYVASYCTLSIA